MSERERYMRATLALALADLMPPALRRAIIADESFSAGFDLATDGVINFSPSNVEIKRSLLLKAVREASKPDDPIVKVVDEAGLDWAVKFERGDEGPRVLIAREGQTIRVRHLGLLSERLDDRLSIVGAEAARVHLPVNSKDAWLRLAEKGGLTDGEVSDFAADVQNTPTEAQARIAGTIEQETVHFDVLVPRGAAYYDRLAGAWNGEADIQTYAADALPKFMKGLVEADAPAGLRMALLLTSHPLAVDRLSEIAISAEEFHSLVIWAVHEADVMTRCSLLELALLRDNVLADTKTILGDIASGLRVPVGETDEDFEMLSGAFVFVYGQMAHLKVFSDRPSFWRRMAALAQAAIISRCMVSKRGALVEFADNLRNSRSRPFALQVYADMRQGPLWQAQFAFLPQLRNEFVGRVISRAANRKAKVRDLGLFDLLLGEGEDSLRSTVNPFFMFTAGPLEDNVPLVQELTGENLVAVEAGLATPKPTAISFAPLVNSVFLFRQTAELADKAAEALQRAQYRLEAESKDIFIAALTGLATCAAVTRSVKLADAVFTVIRYYRRFSPSDLDISAAIRVGFIACASRATMAEWADAIGDLMSSFAFQSLDKGEAGALEQYIRDMCDLCPDLWATCAPALAAAESIAA